MDETRASPPRTTRDLKAGDHVCCLYETEQQYEATLTPFVQQGLERGDRIICIADNHSNTAIQESLKALGIDVASHLSRDQLAFLGHDDPRSKEALRSAGLIGFLQAEVRRTLDQEYTALRVARQMVAGAQAQPMARASGSAALRVEEETGVDAFLADQACMIFCLYERKRFDPQALLDALDLHPFLVVDSQVFQNPHYLTSASLLGRDFAQAKLDHRLRSFHEPSQADTALQESQRRLELFHRAGQAFSSTLELDLVLAKVLDEVCRLLKIVASSIWLVDSETGELVCRQATGPQSDIVRGWRLAPGDGLVGWAAQRGENLIISDAHRDKRHFRGVDRETGLEIRSTLCTPLRIKERVIGVLQAVDTKLGRFDMAELALLEPLAASAAIAIENARLYAKVRQELADRKWAEQGQRRALAEALQATQALRQSEQDKAAVLDSMSEFVVYQDLDMKIRWVNRAAGQSVGLTPEQLVGRHCYEVWHQRDEPCEDCPVIRAREAGELCEGEKTTPDGRIWLIRGYPVRGENGDVEGMVEVALEVTERKRADEELSRALTEALRAKQALQESEERYRSLFEGLPVGLYRTTPAGEILDLNPALVEMLGFPDRRTALQVNAIDMYVDPEDRGRLMALLEQEGTVHDFEAEWRRYDGSSIWVKDTAHAVRDAEGTVLYYEGSLEDITERKLAEETLRESEFRYRTTIDSMRDPIHVVDTDLRIVLRNKALQDWLTDLGLEREMVGRTIPEVFPFLPDRVVDEYRSAFETGTILLTEETTRIGDRAFVTETRKIPVWERGKVVRVVTVIHDVTERRRVEEEAQRRTAQAALTYEVGRRVSGELEMEELLSAIVAAVYEAFHPHSVTLLLLDPEGQWLTLQSIAGGPAGGLPGGLRLRIGEGMTGHAAATGETQVSGDVTTDPQYIRLAEEETRSELAVPIKSGQTLIGVLDLQSDEFDAFDKTDVMVMETLADQVAIAIRNARLYEAVQQELAERRRAEQQVRRLLEQQIIVNQLAVALGESADLDSVYRIIYEHVRGLMDTNAFIVSSFDSETELIHAEFVVTGGTVRDAATFPHIPLDKEGQGNQSQVIRTGQPLHIPDWGRATEKTATEYTVGENRSISEGPPPAQEQEDATRSALLVPMKVSGETIGVMQVQSFRLNAYSAEDRALLSALGNVAAVAIQNARLLGMTREQALQVQRIVDTVPEGVLLLDTEARILLSNPVGQAHLAALTDARVGDVLNRLGPRPLEGLLAAPPRGYWHEISTEELPQRTFEVVAQRMETGSPAGGWVLVLRDVTEERETQARIEQQERLAAMGQLAAGVAHDFNNVLQGIMSFSELLKRRSDVPDTAKEHLGLILQLGERAARINRQILDFTRQSAAQKQPLDLAFFVREAIDLLRRTIPERIEFCFEAGPGTFLVSADATQLQQVLVNLAINARDAMPDGGILTLRLSHVVVAEGQQSLYPGVPPGQWIQLQISDTGTGIQPQILPRIFEPFFTTKEQTGGTGLGLAQVYGIVQQHEGYIDVETEVGRGTTFTLFLPALMGTGADADERSGLTTTGQGQTVLLVEDEPTVLQATRAVLEELGYQVLEAANGREAIRVYDEHSHRIALVLADMVMPEMDGVELFHALRSRDADIQVIAMTGYPLREEGRELLAQGIVAWVQKPVNMAQLAAALGQVLPQGQAPPLSDQDHPPSEG